MMRSYMKTLIQQSLALAGFELRRKEKSAFEVQRALCPQLRPVIFDVGANWGETVAEYRRLFPEAKIYAFEPFPEHVSFLKTTFSKDGNVLLSELALSDHSDERLLFSNNVSATNSLLKTETGAELYWGDMVLTNDSLSVKIETLSNFCKLHTINKIDILKIDTQASELNILHGAVELLERKAIDLLYFEIIIAPTYEHQPRLDEYFNLLYGLGYKLVDIYNPAKKDYRLMQMDALFNAR